MVFFRMHPFMNSSLFEWFLFQKNINDCANNWYTGRHIKPWLVLCSINIEIFLTTLCTFHILIMLPLTARLPFSCVVTIEKKSLNKSAF